VRVHHAVSVRRWGFAGSSPADDAAALRAGPLAAFTAALITRADDRLRARVDVDAARAVLRPWHGTHVVAGCAVASLGPACPS